MRKNENNVDISAVEEMTEIYATPPLIVDLRVQPGQHESPRDL